MLNIISDIAQANNKKFEWTKGLPLRGTILNAAMIN